MGGGANVKAPKIYPEKGDMSRVKSVNRTGGMKPGAHAAPISRTQVLSSWSNLSLCNKLLFLNV